MVDIVCHRKELTPTIGAILGMLMAPARGRRSKAQLRKKQPQRSRLSHDINAGPPSCRTGR
jgi:hypothetical protein